MVTNALSPMQVVEELAQFIDPSGTIAIMSSGQGTEDISTPSEGPVVAVGDRSSPGDRSRIMVRRWPPGVLRAERG
jgi:hypothetical protein